MNENEPPGMAPREHETPKRHTKIDFDVNKCFVGVRTIIKGRVV